MSPAAVSIEDAWGGCASSSETPSSPDGPYPPREDARGVASRRTLRANDEVDASASRRERKRDDLNTLARLCQELALTRQQLEDRESLQSTVMYSALAVILVLLIIVAQAFFKLQHATECLLWYSRR